MTLEALDASPLAWSGAGRTEAESLQAHRVKIGDHAFSYLGFLGWEGNFWPNQVADAEEGKGGAAYGSLENVRASVGREAAAGRLPVVHYHGSREYAEEPTLTTETRMKRAIDEGAVEVHHVKPPRPQGFPVPGHLDGVGRIDTIDLGCLEQNVGADLDLTDGDVLEMYRIMVLARRLDEVGDIDEGLLVVVREPQAARRQGVDSLIEWMGFTRDVNAELAKMDLFVLPSLFGEGLPMVVLEAMSAGVPVVGTRVGYRDVRVELVVEAGKPPAPLVVRCEEQI